MSTGNSNEVKSRTAVGGESWDRIDQVVITALEKATCLYFGMEFKKIAAPYIADLRMICYRCRLYALSEQAELASIWEEMRDHPAMLEFVMFVSFEITMRCSTTTEEFAKMFAEAHTSSWSGMQSDLSGVDNAMVSSVVPGHRLYELLVANPWFITLLLISKSEYFTRIYKGELPIPLE